MPDATLDSIKRTQLALKGPLETPVGEGYRSINVALRKTFDLYANVRPAHSIVPGGRYEDIDLVLVRENTEGLYVGIEHYIKIGDDPRAAAESIAIITRDGSERIVRYAFEYAVKHGRKKVTLVHKANILKFSQGLFLDVGRMVAREYAGTIEFEERIVDAMAMNLVLHPERFDVIVTTNLFGDILSDQISGLVGGLGLAPGANIGSDGAIFEAVHGTAPDIAGKGIANPARSMLAACMMLEHIGDARARAAHPRRARGDDPRGQDGDARPRRHRDDRPVHRRHHRAGCDASRRTVFHCSDLHFGHPAVPEQYEAIEALIPSGSYDVVAISGDLSQRARAGEFQRARAFIRHAERVSRSSACPATTTSRGGTRRSASAIDAGDVRQLPRVHQRGPRAGAAHAGATFVGLNTSQGVTRQHADLEPARHLDHRRS